MKKRSFENFGALVSRGLKEKRVRDQQPKPPLTDSQKRIFRELANRLLKHVEDPRAEAGVLAYQCIDVGRLIIAEAPELFAESLARSTGPGARHCRRALAASPATAGEKQPANEAGSPNNQ